MWIDFVYVIKPIKKQILFIVSHKCRQLFCRLLRNEDCEKGHFRIIKVLKIGVEILTQGNEWF